MSIMENTAQSDLVVKVYTFINFIYDPALIKDRSFDLGSILTSRLSAAFNQNWIVRGYDLNNLTDDFSRNMDAVSKQEGFLNLLLADPSKYVKNSEELEVFLDTLMRISLVHNNRLLVLVNAVPSSELEQFFTQAVNERTSRDSSQLLLSESLNYSDLMVDTLCRAAIDLIARV